MAQLRALLDTCIFGIIFKDAEKDKVADLLIKSRHLFYVYAYKPIRIEIRKNTHESRALLLKLYDSITKNELKHTQEIENIAIEYYQELKSNFPKRTRTFETIQIDLRIVAAAALNNLDIICTQDKKSMSSDNFKRAYDIVNTRRTLRTPNFISYEELKIALKPR